MPTPETPLPDSVLAINVDARPSLLDLDRRLMGEVDGDVPPAHRAATMAAAQDVPPLQLDALRSRATQLQSPRSRRPTGWAWGVLASGMALAAAALLVVGSGAPPTDRTKGGPQLGWMVLHNGTVELGDKDRTVQVGDHLQFTWAGDAETIVLIGVDGAGTHAVLWPEDPARGPVSLSGPTGLLDGSVVLDGQPGPEQFFAVFDAVSVDAAVQQVHDALVSYPSAAALTDWADAHPHVDLVIVDKRP